MRTPRSRPPGFAATHTRETSPGVVARETSATAASDADLAEGQDARNGAARRPASPARLTAAHQQEPKPPAARNPPAPQNNPYAGAATRQFNTRLLEPLHRRYMRLVRDLADDGYETSMTELVHALLHEGPTTTTEARDRVRAWRQLRAAE
jgi:hypothetical protein